MSHFVPPYPERPREKLPTRALIRMSRHNFLGVFEDRCFEQKFFSTRFLARQIFVCNSPETVAEAFIAHHDSFERKSPQIRHALRPLIGDGVFISDGATWKQRRRLVAPILHASQLPQFAPVMIEAAAETAVRWAGLPSGRPLDVLREMAVLTAEIICRTIFGPRLGAEHAAEIADAFSAYQREVRSVDIAYMLGLPDWLPRFQPPSVYRAARRIARVLDEVIERCKKRLASGEPSMIRSLLEARDPDTGEALDREALRNEAAVIFMAGHETTANSLAWTWYLLSQAPEAEERLHEELDQVLGGRLPMLDDVPRLLFTRAVFEETIRLYPPVPAFGRQAARSETIGNQRIPAGALLAIVPWLLHRHRIYWPMPDHFVPERFLPEHAAARQRFTYLPFSVGPRVCAGQAFGLTEAILCLATLAQRARLRLAAGTVVEPVARLTLRPGHSLPMHIEARDPADARPRLSA
jgi:cytochrome P450